jgi:hypothetical protein
MWENNMYRVLVRKLLLSSLLQTQDKNVRVILIWILKTSTEINKTQRIKIWLRVKENTGFINGPSAKYTPTIPTPK